MSEKGFIKLDRAIENWRYATKPLYVALWVHLLVKANHKPKKVYDTEVDRGCLLTSYDKLARGTGLSVQNVRTILRHLDGEEIIVKSTNKNTLISIVKYDFYQGVNKQTNNQLTSNQQTTNNKQETKEIKNEKNISNTNVLLAPTYENVDAFARLPLLENKFYLISYEEVEHYKEQFPAVDVEQEIRNAIAWTEANPKNRKKQGKRFLTNWLLRKQERARAYSTQAKKGDEIFYDTH